ncbi:MAG TPA: hypothetical protein VNN10_00730 [Dehalococcoidia bacterium]|nr:hypothetical protein [Dehalococcoidia bacterium]
MNESIWTEPPPSSAERCRHRWVIAAPNGPTSEGVCRLCGARREFRNSSDDHIGDGALAAEALPANITSH